MRAMLLAAGFGTRLRPLTETIPKCLVPIKGRPLLHIWLERLTQAGFGPFLINTHYLAEQVEEFIEDSLYRDQVRLINERELYGTAGTVITNRAFFQEQDGLVIHADNYCLADFDAFKRAHHNRPAECVMTMMTFRTDSPQNCGIVELDTRGIVVAFHEKVVNAPGNLANCAVYILSSELIKELGLMFVNATSFSEDVINKLVGKIYTYETKSFFLDIGTPETYKKANEYN